jgi:alpha-tubulin suppressor-like RCC1 family protein
LYSTGFNCFGQLGYSVFEENQTNENSIKHKNIIKMSFKFKKIKFGNAGKLIVYMKFSLSDQSVKIKKFIPGTESFYAIDYNYGFYAWGWNEHWNLGTGDNLNYFTPIRIENENLKNFINKKNDKKDYKLKV